MQKLEVQLEDDLTGGPADETVYFGLEGRGYEIDLNAKHAASFRKQLAMFVERARPARARRSHAFSRTSASRERSRAIREWAERQGHDVATHGRLPVSIIREYEEAESGARARHRSTQGSTGRARRSSRGSR